MRRPCAWTSIVVGLFLASCGSAEPASSSVSPIPAVTPATAETAAPQSTIPGPWGHEAEEYLRSYAIAMAGPGTERLAAFYDDEATFTVSFTGVRLEGIDEIRQWLEWHEGTGPAWGPIHVFVAAQKAVVLVREVSNVGAFHPGWDYYTNVYVFTIDDGLVHSFDVEWLTAHLPEIGGLREEHGEQIESLYEEYVTAWNSGAPDRIRSIYAVDAARVDGLFGGSLIPGEDWAASIAAYLRPGAAGVAYEPVGQSFEPQDEVVTPALFSPASFSEPTITHAIFDLRTNDGCPLRLMAEWELDGPDITGEELLYDVGSLRRCGSVFGVDSPPAGWWTGVSPPSPFIEEVTATVATATGKEIVVTNGHRRQIELLKWGLDRFSAAGLPQPRLDLVAFPPTQECAAVEASGLARYDEESAYVFMCLSEAAVCADPACKNYRLSARLALLHELAHVWEFQNVDQASRRDFMHLRGLEVWSDADSGWAEGGNEGVEHAAEILAWGLMDEPIDLIRIPDTTEEALEAAFQMLTGGNRSQ